MEWKHPQSPIRRKFKSQQSAEKLMLSFLGLKAQYCNIIRREVLQQSASYSEMVIDRLKHEIRSKRRQMSKDTVVA